MSKRIISLFILSIVLGFLSSVWGADRGAILSGETKVGLNITAPSYMDTWTFNGSTDDRVIVSAVTTSGALNTDIILYPPGGGAAVAHPGACGDWLDYQLQTSGTYTIVIRDCGLSNGGTYNISFLKIPGAVSSPGDPDGGPIASGQTLNGTLNVVSDIDAFQFDGAAGDRVIVSGVTTSGTLNTDIILYPPGGGAAVAHPGACGDWLEYQLQTSGTYTIVIRDCGLTNTGPYNLSFLKIPGGDPIVSGQTLSGTINSPSVMDEYQFYGAAGDRVIVSGVTTSGTLNTDIILYPPGGGAAVAHPGACGDWLEYQLQTSGTYTIVIRDCGLTNAGTYNISFLKIPGAVSSPGDPDGGPIASGQTLSGTMNVVSDIDAFQFYGAAGDRVIISAVTTSGALNTDIILYPPGGGAAVAHPGACGDWLEYQLQTSGTYTIVIRDCGLTNTGPYNISFLKIPGAVSSPGDPDGGPIASGQAKIGNIDARSDVDAFYFYGAAGDRVIVSGVTTSGTLNTDIILYPPGGGAAVAHPGACGDLIDYQLTNTGLFTVVIRDCSLTNTGGYNISLSKIPSDLRPGIYNPSPSVGEIVSGFSGFFSWTPVGGSTGYDLYFGENVVEPLVKVSDNLQTPSMPFPSLVCGKIYYWHVVAHVPAGDIQGPYWWFQTSNCKPSIVDFDGDRKTDIAIYRAGNGAWYIYPSGGSSPYGVGWGGVANDKPVPGDYDGDGKTDVAIYRPSTGAWYIYPSGDNPPYGVGWGGDASDVPVPGDYDGDGNTDLAIYRTNNGVWYIIPSSTPGTPYGVGWGGNASDKPVPGDYDRDGKTDVAIYRTSTGVWYIIPSSTPGSPYSVGWGGDASDRPVPGDYDGDGKTDIAVYRSNTGAWYIMPSSGAPPYGVGWGGDGTDLPVTTNPASYM